MRTTSITTAVMEAVHTSETSVHFNVTTRRYIPEDPKLYLFVDYLMMLSTPHYTDQMIR
jgi:hypothetical protein